MPKKRKHKKKSFIKNYGLMWRRDLVSWAGSRGKKGQLLGRRKKVIDFRKQIGVYVLYNENRLPIYVGQAGQGESDRLLVRLRTHTHDRLAERWRYFSWFGLLAVNASGRLSAWDKKTKAVRGTIGSTLDEIEGVLIAATEPPFNKQGAKFQGIKRFQQVSPEEAEPVSPGELRDLIDDLSRKIDKLRRK